MRPRAAGDRGAPHRRRHRLESDNRPASRPRFIRPQLCTLVSGRQWLLAWLTRLDWPFEGAVLDGELCAALGIEGFRLLRTERQRAHGQTQVTVFDCLALHDRSLLSEAWTARRQVLEQLLAPPPDPRIRLVPTTPDAPRLWAQWTAWGGEGIVLKDPAAPYHPGERTRAWLKLKARAGSDAPPALLAAARERSAL